MNNRMLSTLMSLFTLIAINFIAGCKSQEAPCSWADKPMQVDGKMADWTGLPTTYFEDEGAVFGLSNDDNNLFIQIRFKDMKWVRTIKMSGLSLWFDNKGKKNKDIGIKFHGAPSCLDMSKLREGESGEDKSDANRERMGKMMPKMEDRLVFIDTKGLIETTIPFDGSRGPAVHTDTSMGFYLYEFSIPLGESNINAYGMNAQPGQKISIGAEWGDMGDMKNKMNEMGGPPGGMGGGMGGGRGGGMGGGRGMGGPPSGMQTPEKQEIWIKTILATPNSQKQDDQS